MTASVIQKGYESKKARERKGEKGQENNAPRGELAHGSVSNFGARWSLSTVALPLDLTN